MRQKTKMMFVTGLAILFFIVLMKIAGGFKEVPNLIKSTLKGA